MRRIRVIIEDDNRVYTEQAFVMEGDLDTLDAIDEAVEQFKNETLPKIEQELLLQSQERLVVQEKKDSPSEATEVTQ